MSKSPKKTTRKNKKKSSKIQRSMYEFGSIFYVNYALGYIVPRYNVVINGVRVNQGTIINRNSLVGGLNLFDYIGRRIAGTWEDATRTVVINGFY